LPVLSIRFDQMPMGREIVVVVGQRDEGGILVKRRFQKNPPRPHPLIPNPTGHALTASEFKPLFVKAFAGAFHVIVG